MSKMWGKGTESQEHRHINQPRERAEKGLDLTPLPEGAGGWRTHGGRKGTKEHEEKHLRLGGGEKPGPVNLFLRVPLCHLKYCQQRSFWSSSEGSSTPTLGSRKRERECDGDHGGGGGDRSSGHGTWTTSVHQRTGWLTTNIDPNPLFSCPHCLRARQAATLKFKATMSGAGSNEINWEGRRASQNIMEGNQRNECNACIMNSHFSGIRPAS